MSWPPEVSHSDCEGRRLIGRTGTEGVVWDEGTRQVSAGIPKWPIYSDAAGVHPADIPTYTKYLKEQGCGETNFTPDGRIEWKDRQHKMKCNKAMGFIDKSGYQTYG